MAIVIASSHLSDEQFLAGFESCELPLAGFRHGDHLRMAWLYVHREPIEEAMEKVQGGIRRFATHYGVGHIFHVTMTAAWVKLIATHSEKDFAEFVAVNEARLNLELLHGFWTPELLGSEAARMGWVAPDRAALPG
jgi:hypothetical protein